MGKYVSVAGLGLAAGILATAGGTVPTASASGYRKVVDQYCVGCHNQRLASGGLRLDSADLGKVAAGAETWEKVIRKLRAGAMPPPGIPRPDAATYKSFTLWLETQIDAAAQANPYAGRPMLHRMNRAEYANAIRDLLALDVDTGSLLPPDDSAYGFDNVSDVLGVSPTLEERYLSAAASISALAVGDMHASAGTTTYRIRQDLSQNKHIEGLPLGTVGGIEVRHNFPLDGEYIFQAKLYRTNLNIMRGLEFPSQVEFAVNGQRVYLASLGGTADLASLFERPTETGDEVDARLRVRVAVKAGPQAVSAAFLEDANVVSPERLQPFLRSSADNFDWSGWPHIQTFSITGPLNATGPGDTPSRRRIFVCHPESQAPLSQAPLSQAPSSQAMEQGCAKEILSTLMRRAYRRPVNEGDLARVMGFYEKGRYANGGNFDSGIELALRRILASPKFVFRAETDPAGAAPGSVHPISELELASRLAFFLWSSAPDDELLTLAAKNKLSKPGVLDAQVRRMLADAKSQALVTNFAGQWLQLRNVRNVLPNSDLFPDFDDNLRESMRQETELFFASMLREDHPVLDLITADYTFVNERLARHYGIPGIYGSQFRRVHVEAEARRGLLGQASILAVTSHSDRTSPVVRGKWILENILGTPVPGPPPNVPPLPDAKPGEQPRTMKEQMETHRANAVCASCHKVMDPLGFAMENFDAVGAWRAQDGGTPIDSSAVLSDGTKVEGVAGLRKMILSRPEAFVGAVTEKLMTYGLGRGLDYRDMPAVRKIVANAARDNYRFSDLILGVVRSVEFQMRTTPDKAVAVARAEGN